jgi:hypothetical protein
LTSCGSASLIVFDVGDACVVPAMSIGYCTP